MINENMLSELSGAAAVKFTAAVCTLGCRVNQYESDCIISEFINLGFEIKDFNSDSGDLCDVYVMNTCTVTAGSDKKSKQMIRRAKKLNPNAIIAVCGCFSQKNPEVLKYDLQADIVCGTSEKTKIPQIALDILKNNSHETNIYVKDISKYRNYENVNAYQSEKTRAYIKIQDGCDANCSYCIIPQVRGCVKSREYQDIYNEVKRFNDMNCHEVVLTGIEISSYGKDFKNKNISLVNFLEKLDSEPELNNITSIRLSSIEPSLLKKDFIDRLAELNKITNHFHLSLQSGSTRILNLMRRKYNAETVIQNIEYAKEKIKDLILTADIIVGFPNETDEDFEKTVNIIKLLNIYHTHIFTYSKRPGTDAADFDNQIREDIKNARSKRLSEICGKIKEDIHKNCIDRAFDVIIEDFDGGFYTAKTRNFIDVKIKVKDNVNLHGTVQKIKITDFDKDFIYGELNEQPVC
ncbi:MAG: tRNA (N(6)-L-threonylcarbamoyladenosine(37)-C(2))-methylthiotransferase MtaB [Oscillospiraceae bacterium]|nr:tRNA (N(6)-L-threonylcarbamoyladenosine(37)-C(2))-methylthiotransferase MtaB [Oscillospiraceae bacterium]